MLSTPKAILFDWDNTLADTWPVIYQALHDTFVDMGHVPWTLEETKFSVHRSMRDAFPKIFGDRWEEAAKLYQSYFQASHLQNLVMLQGAEEVLKLLASTELFVGVVSNKTGHNLRKEINHIGWNHYFHKIVGATDAKADKPSCEPVLFALEGSGVTMNEQVWLIGDSITDMECAYNSGITPVFYGDGDLSTEQYKNYQPKKHLRNHEELLAFIQSVVR